MKIAAIASHKISQLDPTKLQDSLNSPQTITVKPHDSMETIAQRYREEDGGLVIVIDEHGKPAAILDPKEVIRLAMEEAARRVTSFRGATGQLQSARLRRRLLYARPSPHWCARGNHYTDSNPCPVHEV